MTFATNTLWFEVAVMCGLFALGHILFGHFEERTPRWRKLAKFIILTGVFVLVSATAGREWFFALLGLAAVAVTVVHAWLLPVRYGINGWTAEPWEKYYALRGWTTDRPDSRGQPTAER
jgi:hypothetical protein